MTMFGLMLFSTCCCVHRRAAAADCHAALGIALAMGRGRYGLPVDRTIRCFDSSALCSPLTGTGFVTMVLFR